jgi:F-type H+-transporting ATPase subunit delta
LPDIKARRFAQALVDALKSDEDLALVDRDLDRLRTALLALPALGRLLAHPGLPADRKKPLIIQALGGAEGQPATNALLAILAEQRRLPLLPEIASWFRRLKDRRMGLTPVEVTTAGPLREGDQTAWSSAMAAAAGTRVRIDFKTDPSLIGGAVAKVGSVLYDGSARGSLERIRESLLGE